MPTTEDIRVDLWVCRFIMCYKEMLDVINTERRVANYKVYPSLQTALLVVDVGALSC